MTNEGPETHPAKINFDEIFQKNPSQTVDFEIVFAGLLAASLASVSGISPMLDFVSVAGAIILLLFTMIRRMALDNPFALERRLMEISLTIIFAITFFGVVYLVAYPAELIHNQLSVNYYLNFGVLLFFLIIGGLLLYEYSFRDFLLWAGILLYNRHTNHHEDEMGNILLNLSKFSLNKSFTSSNEMPEEVSNIHDIDEREADTTQKIFSYIGIFLGVLFFVGLLFVIGNIARLAVTGSVFELGLAFTLLIIAMTALTGIVEFWFSRYGNAVFSELAGWKKRAIIHFVAFLTIIISDPKVSAVNILESILRLI